MDRARTLLTAVGVLSAGVALDLDAVLDALTEQARLLFLADEVTISLATADGTGLIRRTGSVLALAHDSLARPGTPAYFDDIVVEAMTTGRPAYAPDFSTDPRIASEARAALPNVVSSVVAPLIAGNTFLGALNTRWTRRVVLSEEDLDTIQALAQHAAIAIRTARLLVNARHAHAELEAIEEAIPDAIMVIAPDGRILRANRAARGLFIRVFNEEPNNIAMLCARGTPIVRSGLDTNAFDSALQGKVATSETVFFTADGELRISSSVAPARNIDGTIPYVVIVARDITAMHRTITDHARMDGAVKTARTLAHEINNRMTFLTGYGDLLPLLVQGEAADMAREMAQAAREVADLTTRLQSIVRFAETDVGGGAMLDLNASIDAPAKSSPPEVSSN